jgi:hypothetical protein
MQERALYDHGKKTEMNLPHFPEFERIGLEDQEYIQSVIDEYPSEACEINFGNIFIWRNFEHSKLTLLNDNLCILCEPPSEPAYFLQPIGNCKIKETIKICLSSAHRLSRVPESFVARYCTDYRCEPDRNNFDYVYLSKDLIDLKGKKYDGKRNRIKKFEKNHASKYIRLSREHLEDCRHLFEEWLKSKSPSDTQLNPQKDAILEALAYFETLRLVGGAVEVDGRLAAFSIGEKLNTDTAAIHIEIINRAYDGLAQFINREFVKNELSGYKYINREQDIGIAGLRRAKMSYHPHRLIKKYNIWG